MSMASGIVRRKNKNNLKGLYSVLYRFVATPGQKVSFRTPKITGTRNNREDSLSPINFQHARKLFNIEKGGGVITSHHFIRLEKRVVS